MTWEDKATVAARELVAAMHAELVRYGLVAWTAGRSRAVLMRNHGVFTIGKDARDAVKAAVMAEDAARTVHIARQIWQPVPIASETIDALFNRYQNVYGQQPQGALS
jgi:L-ribulose-5-phosphate 4-epimerase